MVDFLGLSVDLFLAVRGLVAVKYLVSLILLLVNFNGDVGLRYVVTVLTVCEGMDGFLNP